MEGGNPIAAIVQPSALRPHVFAGLSGGLCGLTALIVTLRLWTHYTHIRKLHADDCKLPSLYLSPHFSIPPVSSDKKWTIFKDSR